MPSTKLKTTILAIGLILFSPTSSSASGGGEAKPAEGGEGAAAPTENKETRQFNEKNTKLKTLATKIEDTEKEFNDLVHHKAQEKDPDAIQGILKQMVDAARRRNKAIDDYDKLKSELELRFPNQGEVSERQYQTHSKKSVEELEGVAGLDELLTRTKKIVEKKFAAFNEPDEKKGEARPSLALPTPSPTGRPAPGHADTPPGEKPKRLRLEK